MADLGFITYFTLDEETGRRDIIGILPETFEIKVTGSVPRGTFGTHTVTIQFDVENSKVDEESTIGTDKVFLKLKTGSSISPYDVDVEYDLAMDVTENEGRRINSNIDFNFKDGKIGGAGPFSFTRSELEKHQNGY